MPAALVACVVAWWSLPPDRRPAGHSGRRRAAGLAGLAAAVAAGVAALFFSSFLAAPEGVIEPARAIGTYLDRGIDFETHAHPWHYYLGLLAYSSSGGTTWSESFVLVMAIFGLTAVVRGPDASRAHGPFWTRYFAAYALISTVVFSVIRYKTPWNVLPFYAGVLVLGGIGFSTLVHAAASRAVRGAVVAIFLLASGHLAWQAWRASVTYAADPRNPYVYAQTVPDAVRMAARIRELAALHPDGERMQVSVLAPPAEQWPLPWYLRAMPHVGYWIAPGDALALRAPVIVSSLEHAAALDRSLGERYLSSFYGLRPDVLLVLYVERGWWERFLARVASCAATPPFPARSRERAGSLSAEL